VHRFGMSLLLGFAVLVVTPFLAVLLAITFVGVIPAIVILLGYIIVLIVAKIYSGILVGAFLSNWWKKDIRTNWKWALVGTLALGIISFLPIVGGIACFIFFLASLGALANRAHSWWKMRNNGPMLEVVH
jgi:hypothetical protein